jgi:hypothetical protein
VFVEAVLANVDGEHDPAVVTALLGQARTAAVLYTADGRAPLDALAEASSRAAGAAQAGSDLQLARVRAFAGTARSAPHADVLEQLLAGQAPEGWSSTPTCAGRWSRRWPPSAGSTTRRWTPSWPGTTPRPAGCTRSPPGRRCRPRRPRSAPGRGHRSGPDQQRGAGGHRGLLATRSGRAAGAVRRPLRRRAPRGLGRAQPGSRRSAGQSLFPSTLVAQDALDRTAVLLDPSQPPGLRRYVA